MSKINMFATVCVCALVAGAGSASASQFYGVTTSGQLLRYDMAAHTVTPVSSLHAGTTSLNNGFVELEADGAGNLYAIRNYSGDVGFPPEQFNEIWRITNPALGNSLLSTSINGGGFGQIYTSLAYRPATGDFYSVRNQNGNLGVLDVTNGALNPVSGMPHGSPYFTSGLAVNPVSGMAYSIVDRGIPIFGTVDYTLLAMDLNTGLSTTIGSLGLGAAAVMDGGIRFDESGTAYTVYPQTGDVYTINLNTGAATFLFAGGATAVGTTGLALIHTVPAPSALGIAFIATLAGARRRR